MDVKLHWPTLIYRKKFMWSNLKSSLHLDRSRKCRSYSSLCMAFYYSSLYKSNLLHQSRTSHVLQNSLPSFRIGLMRSHHVTIALHMSFEDLSGMACRLSINTWKALCVCEREYLSTYLCSFNTGNHQSCAKLSPNYDGLSGIRIVNLDLKVRMLHPFRLSFGQPFNAILGKSANRKFRTSLFLTISK